MSIARRRGGLFGIALVGAASSPAPRARTPSVIDRRIRRTHCSSTSRTASNPTSPSVSDSRIHRDLDPTRSQEEIATRATALGNALIAARPQAKQGDIFSPEVAAFLATLIREEYKRRSPPVLETREDQQEELPDFVPKVNQIYPTTYPLATFPPALLPVLPPLPEEVEYRIVQNYLILRDVEANLIVDFMPGGVPSGG